MKKQGRVVHRTFAAGAPRRRSAARSPRQLAPGRPAATPAAASAGPALLMMLAWAALLGWGVWAGRLPPLTLVAAALLNLATFYVYWTDKHAAQNGQWRTREDTLHWLGLLGGWPGAWWAHQILRHKSRKAAFRRTYWATVLLHCAALAAWLFWLQPGRLLLR